MAKKQRQKIVTCKLNEKFPQLLDSFIALGTPIEVGLGKYSSYIITKNSNTKYKFLTKLQTKKTFIGYVKILKDLKRPEVEVVLSDLKDSIKESNNTYFDYGKAQNCEYENAVCVDLNSAYLQALYNLTLITKDTKDWIEKYLTKSERLVAVGMLAKQKEILEFNNSKLISDTKEDAKNRFIFNAVIQEVASVMNKVALHHIDDFISYWVDGIYLKNEYIAFEVVDQFEKAGFPCKIEELTDFKGKMSWSHMSYTYNKDGKSKKLDLPIRAVHDLRKRRIVSVINSKRIERSMPTLSADDLSQRKYSQGLLSLT